MSLSRRWTTMLDGLRAAGRYRTLQVPTGVDFVSNDYLGYAREFPPSRCTDASTSGTSSRLLRGHLPIWEQVEAELCRWHGAGASLMMNSGYCANEGLLSTLLQPGDWVASDRLNHASIIDGLRLCRAERFIFEHCDLDHLETGLRQAAAGRLPGRQLFIVTESLFGMEGDLAPLAEMLKLAQRYEAHLLVDEAHATGCFGPSGGGGVDMAGLRPEILASVHTGGKALGICGAYICGSPLLRDVLVNRCRHLIFTTALPPAIGAWWLEALARVRQDETRRARLHARASFFREALRSHGIEAPGLHYIVPILIGDDEQAVSISRQLQARGWDIRAIRPPTVPIGTARLRISIHAPHDEAMLTDLAAAISHCLQASRERQRPE